MLVLRPVCVLKDVKKEKKEKENKKEDYSQDETERRRVEERDSRIFEENSD